MLYLLCGVGGIILGTLVTWLIIRAKTVGTLLVVTTHLTDQPYLCIDGLEVDPHEVKKMKRISFKVRANNSHN